MNCIVCNGPITMMCRQGAGEDYCCANCQDGKPKDRETLSNRQIDE